MTARGINRLVWSWEEDPWPFNVDTRSLDPSANPSKPVTEITVISYDARDIMEPALYMCGAG